VMSPYLEKRESRYRRRSTHWINKNTFLQRLLQWCGDTCESRPVFIAVPTLDCGATAGLSKTRCSTQMRTLHYESAVA
jgi:hypothetical protein